MIPLDNVLISAQKKHKNYLLVYTYCTIKIHLKTRIEYLILIKKCQESGILRVLIPLLEHLICTKQLTLKCSKIGDIFNCDQACLCKLKFLIITL